MEALAIAEADLPAHGEEDTSAQQNGQDSAQHKSDAAQENRFQKAVAAWRGVGLTTLIAQLDSTATNIVTHQKDALLERKDVAQKTKDFRKLDDAGKLSEYKSLLKSYQTFVDLLTTHGKESTAAFLQLYTALADVPDPFPLLEASIEALVVSEDTLPKLTTENAELQKRVVTLTNQLDSAEQNLQSERKLRQDAEKGWDSKVEEVESSWRKVLEEKEGNWSAKETALNERLENQDRLLKEVKASYEVSRRLGEEETETAAAEKAASAELRLVTSDLERTSARLAESQARNEQLRIDLARISSQSGQSANDDSAQLLRLQNENSSLLRRMETTRFERDAEKRDIEAKLRQIDRQRASAHDQVQDLKKKLHQFSDYDEIKRELNMLRTIELAEANDEDDDTEAPANGSVDSKRPQKESLEQLLLARNKKLTDDMAILRVSHQELTQQLDQLREELSGTNAELEKSQKLSSTLENDLLQLQEEAANGLPSSAMSVAGTYTSRYPNGSLRRGRSSPTSSIISGFDGHGRSSVAGLGSSDTYGGGSGILPMVQAQRDRFKQKIQKLEEELQKTYATVTSLRQEVGSLQKDNLNLYEKSRYVSAYNRGGATSSTMGDQPRQSSIYAVDDGDTGRWKTQYEANISPFAAFRGREAARAYKRMNVPERMIFSLTRLVLATRTSRNLFAGYCLALHILVFMMLYWMSAASTAVSVIDKQATGAAIAAAAGFKDGAAGAAHGANWRQEDFG